MEMGKIGNAYLLTHIEMIVINAKAYVENGASTINVIKKGNKSVFWINMHDIQNKLGVTKSCLTIKEITGIYNTETLTKEQIKKYKRYGKELRADLTGIYIRENQLNLGFNPYDPKMRKEQPVLTKIMKALASDEILSENSGLGYRIDLHFPKHKLAIETGEKGHKDRKEYKEIERENSVKEDADWRFIRINLMKKIFMSILELIKYTITLKSHLKIFNRQEFEKLLELNSSQLLKICFQKLIV